MCIVVNLSPLHTFNFTGKKVYISNGAGYIVINKSSDLNKKITLPESISLELVVAEDKFKLKTRIINYKHNYRIFISKNIIRSLEEEYKLDKNNLKADVTLEVWKEEARAKVKIKGG